jgi:hypothetical protein
LPDEADPYEPVEVFASLTFPVWMGNTTIHFTNPLSELEALTFIVICYNRPSSVAPFELIGHEVSMPGFDLLILITLTTVIIITIYLLTL